MIKIFRKVVIVVCGDISSIFGSLEFEIGEERL